MSVPSVVPIGVHKSTARRGSASRAVAAVQNETFPITPSPSPLIRVESNKIAARPRKFLRYANEADLEAAFSHSDPLASERERLSDFYTIVKGRTTLLSLPDGVLKHLLAFLGDHLGAFIPITRVCKRLLYLTYDLERKVVLVPTLVSTEKLSQPGSMASLGRHLGPHSRGPHITSFAVIDSKAVVQLPRQITGPTVSKVGLQGVLSHLPALVKLDIRGVVFRDHTPATDHFLADLWCVCPKLQQLRIGVSLLRCWEPQWWSRLNHLSEFVVGSRREDVDWMDPTPVTLHEDVLTMLRSPVLKWNAVKFWCALSPASMQQLLSPSAPFPELRHLAINAAGNTSMRPLDDSAGLVDPMGGAGGIAAAGDKKKADPKAKKGAVDEAVATKHLFPALQSFTVADVHERLEFASELAVKLTLMAPKMQHYNVTNTHRNAPSKPAPVPLKASKRPAA